jgi:hypothetical protein
MIADALEVCCQVNEPLVSSKHWCDAVLVAPLAAHALDLPEAVVCLHCTDERVVDDERLALDTRLH